MAVTPEGYIDPANPVDQTADSIACEVLYEPFMRAALATRGHTPEGIELIEFINGAKASDFTATPPDSIPPAARVLREYPASERKFALKALKLKFGILAATDTFMGAISLVLKSTDLRRYDRDGCDGSLLVECSAIKKSLDLIRR